ncbi:ribosomal RNA-processing protein 7 homolog A isoform X2 [Anolis carolinensis]|uniref:Ribosomal RNA-processing protein 7 homolog A n=1 Tax=Anolis carolinensis TaxID=28377 RepID=H9G7R7_ANOCA|nr:PREDICTED: ribosomal RNA-processing protein 7 homolog A [Anolis carolinensis]|eukprot:XP_003228325.1 PREDICTED: ribosomal RNA-processing protein 7 homolog A [Anolis carolinensis]
MATPGKRPERSGSPAAPLGFAVIPVKFSEKHQSPHFLYVKEHKVREDKDHNRPQNNTLFVLNVPPYCTEECLSRLFSGFGSVQSVELCEKPMLGEKKKPPKTKFFGATKPLGFQVAYVVFKSPAGVQAAKSVSTDEPLVISSNKHPVQTGIQKWIANYAALIVNPVELKTEVDAFMQAYDQKIAKEEAKAEKEDGVPDEEGWVKVTRKGRRPGLPRTEAANLRALEREKRKRARKELLNFYAWQHHETKREHIAQLRKKFEEDKQKIALMRAQRKFRPY